MYPEWNVSTNWDYKPIGDVLSKQYANGAKGMATYVYPSCYKGEVWLNIEKTIL